MTSKKTSKFPYLYLFLPLILASCAHSSTSHPSSSQTNIPSISPKPHRVFLDKVNEVRDLYHQEKYEEAAARLEEARRIFSQHQLVSYWDGQLKSGSLYRRLLVRARKRTAQGDLKGALSDYQRMEQLESPSEKLKK